MKLGPIFLVGMSLAFMACKSNSDSSLIDAVTSNPVTGSPLLQAIATAPDLETALTKIPSDFFDRAVVVYASKSNQGASFESPRVIVSSADKSSILAYTASNLANGDSIEAIEFRDEQFHFSKVTFGEQGSTFHDNPSECIRCHSYVGHPNFEPYFFWPGVYGSDDGFLNAPEAKGYGAFANKISSEKASGAGRYRFLTPFNLQSHLSMRNNVDFLSTLIPSFSQHIIGNLKRNPFVTPYRDAILAMLSCEQPADIIPDSLAVQFNTDFQEARDLRRKLASNALAVRLENFKNTTGEPPSGRSKALADYLAAQSSLPLESADFKYSDACFFDVCPDAEALRSDAPQGGAFPLGPAWTRQSHEFTALRFYLEQVVGIDVSTWSLAFMARDFRFGDFYRMVTALTADPEFNPGGVYPKFDPGGTTKFRDYQALVCDIAKKRQSKDLALYSSYQEKSDPTFVTFQKCAGCHSKSDAAGFIPFGRPIALRRFLTANPGLGDEILRRIAAPVEDVPYHMPQTGSLESGEIAAIQAFVK